MMRVLVFLLIVLLIASCGKQNEQYDKPYLDFDSLINAQIQTLRSKAITIQKDASMKDQQSQGQVAGDSLTLARELDIFRQLDFINRPMFRNQYTIAEQPDTKSNLTVRVYRANIPSPMKEVRLYYLGDLKKLKRIESQFEEENTLYYTRRNYTLEFEETDGVAWLRQSRVGGVQKMILNDSVHFFVTSTYSLH